MSDFNWNFPAGTKYSGKSFREVCETAQEEFYNKNRYYPTTEQAVELTNKVKKEIEQEKNKK